MRTKLSWLLLIAVISIPSVSFAAKKIFILGDSLSAGYKIDINSGWVSLLAKKLANQNFDYKVINSSITNDTTKNGLLRIVKELDNHTPNILILALGSNDGLRGIKPKNIKNNLERIIKLSKKHGSKILLVGFKVPGNYGEVYSYQFKNLFKDLAKKHSLDFVPFLLDGFARDEKNYFIEDGLHPNEKAQPIILENVWIKLEPML